MIATRSTVTLSKEAIRALDLHRKAELDERIENLTRLLKTIVIDLDKAITEREALIILVSQ